MRIAYGLGSIGCCIALAGVFLVSDGWAEDKPSPAREKIQNAVKCDLDVTSVTCKATDNSFTFQAHMEQPVSAGSNGNGTMTFESAVSNYKNVNCSIDVDPDIGAVDGDIWCNSHHATLVQPTSSQLFANRVHGNGGFW
ncbi:hypothetical protein [Bordetella genomosp. 11]|uniref:Uncharacterized protein n=1 Tax=Bordetella genomosp. 11 TaxID=1416808 RepID=A0A261UXP7_9BORD|nr:hypothetical protein [Bordetella genomosp. 11]OZI66435.1 hypothetical protein CAL28_01465 [Bordetella genomosp. 11]